MDERDEPIRHETTIINTGERGGGRGMTMLAIVILLLAGLGAFLYFSGYLDSGGSKSRDVNINISAPDININPGGGGNSAQ